MEESHAGGGKISKRKKNGKSLAMEMKDYGKEKGLKKIQCAC